MLLARGNTKIEAAPPGKSPQKVCSINLRVLSDTVTKPEAQIIVCQPKYAITSASDIH